MTTEIKLNITTRRIKELIGTGWFSKTDAGIYGITEGALEALVEVGRLMKASRSDLRTSSYKLTASKFKFDDKIETLFGDDFVEMTVLYFDGVNYRCRYEDEQGQTDVWRYPDEVFEVEFAKPANQDSITALRAIFAKMSKSEPAPAKEEFVPTMDLNEAVRLYKRYRGAMSFAVEELSHDYGIPRLEAYKLYRQIVGNAK